jgi:heterodisulfide reductase subunit A2
MVNDNVKIGVYICYCGSNIAGKVDVEEVAKFAAGLPHVAASRTYKYMCSDPGQEMIKNDIKNLGVNRVVVASCSPTMHERTFRGACKAAGLNPYLFQMANIREHVSWITEDPKAATEKARDLVSAAVGRVYFQEPLEARQVPVCPNTLVVGGGVAGIQAALEIADSKHTVYLVEREPSIGGHMIQLDKTFPTLDCSACILTPKMSTVGAHPFIKLMTYSEIESVSGYVGNFKVRVRKKARYVDTTKCTGCGRCPELCPTKVDNAFEMNMVQRKAIYIPFAQAVPNKAVIDAENCRHLKGLKDGKNLCRLCQTGIEKKGIAGCEAGAINFEQKDEVVEIEVGSIILATGYDVFDAKRLFQYGYGRFDNVITAMEFERMINASGPTGGRVVKKDGTEPKTVAIIHCVGSRDKNYHEYCSQVCCMYSMKFGHLVKEHAEGAKVYEFYIDLRAVGKGFEEFYNRGLDEGTVFVRGRPGEVSEKDGKLLVHTEDTLANLQRQIPVDMVILSTGLEPKADTEAVGRIFSVSRSQDGFFLEKHPKLDPVATMTDGVFVAGCCQAPKDIPQSVAQASAAAARVLAMISAGTINIEAAISAVNEELCSGCKICSDVCPYDAISFDAQKKTSNINPALCKGCGVCVAACPSGAITGRHFTTQQIMAEIDGILADNKAKAEVKTR